MTEQERQDLRRRLAESEEWRRIPNYFGYEVSNLGNVRSWRHKTGLRKNPFTLKQNNTGTYFMVQLWINGKCYPKLVHTLVLSAFIGPCAIGMQACHNDGNGFNNHLSNLRWDTCRNNNLDKYVHGTMLLGSKTNSSKLTESDVINIRHDYHHNKLGCVKLGRNYEVCFSTICRIIRRETWKHL